MVKHLRTILENGHVNKPGNDTAQVGKMRYHVARICKENVKRNHHPHSMLDSHRDDKEHENHAFREELVIRDKDAHQSARRTDNRIVRKPEQAHEKAEQRSKNATEKVHRNKMTRSHPFCHFGAEHPEHQHVEEEMHKVKMDEHVRHVTPKFQRDPRHKRTIVTDVIRQGSVSSPQINFKSTPKKSDNKYSCIRKQKRLQSFGQIFKRFHKPSYTLLKALTPYSSARI